MGRRGRAGGEQVGSDLVPVRLLGLQAGVAPEDGMAVRDGEDAIEIELRTGDRIRVRGRLARSLSRRIVGMLERDRC